MADKEATVYIVDLGSSMGNCNSGRVESDLDWSMRYVWDKISTTVAASRKTWTVGVVGLRTDETRNSLQDDDGYENISVLKDLGPITMSDLKELRSVIRPNETSNGDAISAIVIASELIEKFTKKLKYNRKIILVTDGQGPIDSDDLDDISKRINDIGVQLIVIGVDFDDADYGFKEEDKPRLKSNNETLLKSLVSKCDDGVYGTIAQAVDELQNPRVKSVRLVKNYDGRLTLGNPDEFESAMSINVERWPKTKISRPPAASTVVLKSDPSGASQSTQTLDEMDGVEYSDGVAFSNVKQMRTYKVNDPSAPGGKKEVEFDALAKGYNYGSTAVPISESDWNVTKLETRKDFTIIGFIPSDKYEPFLNMGEAHAIVARKFDEPSELGLSALIHALYELESYAVARFVVKDGKDPVLLLLMPNIEPDFECLYDIPLPFAEDVRLYQFPPLDKVITISGNSLTKHRLLPEEQLTQAMSDYVDSMDLSNFGSDDEGNPAEYAIVDDTFSPAIHRINQVIRQRAVNPDAEVERIPDNLLKFSHPPKDLVHKAKPDIDALIAAADVKKVPEKAKARGGRKESSKPVSGLDLHDLLGPPSKRKKVSVENSIPEFKQMMEVTTSETDIENAARQMGHVIRSLINDSTGDSGYDRAIENLGVLRDELAKIEAPAIYNIFLRDLKKRLLAKELGGDRREMWMKIRWGRNLGLIDSSRSPASNVTPEEAAEFLKSQ